MGTIEENDFYEICAYLNDRCLEYDRNTETPFELYFALKSGMNAYASGVYTNVRYPEKETGTFINKVNKIYIQDLDFEGDPFTGKIVRDITRYVNNNLYTC
jgi:hypothetical protein